MIESTVRPTVYNTVYDVTSYGGGSQSAIGRWQPGVTEPISQSTPTIYVDADATGAGDGSSWADAYTTIMAAHAAASAGDVISVSGGASGHTYVETLNITKGVTIQGSTESGHDGEVTIGSGIYLHNTTGTITINNLKAEHSVEITPLYFYASSNSVFNNFTINNIVTGNSYSRVYDCTAVFNYCDIGRSVRTNSGASTFLIGFDAFDFTFNYCTFDYSSYISATSAENIAIAPPPTNGIKDATTADK